LSAAASLAAGVLVLACAETGYSVRPTHPIGPVPPEVSFFYEDLAPYGSWVTVESYGEVWVPRVAGWWRPYTEGRWVLTDDGWTWIADEPWGWAPYHYGRWYRDPRWGWAWVPGRVWAPAWVAWRSGGGHVGWAPLPPQARWEGDVEFGAGSFDFDAYIAPEHWCFVEERYLTAPAIRGYLVPPARSVGYLPSTRNVTRYTVSDGRIHNAGLDVSQVERATEHAVPRYQIVDRPGPGATSASEGRVSIYRPLRRDGAPAHEPPPPPPASAVTRPPAQHESASPARSQPSQQEISARQENERHELERHQSEERARVRQLQDDDRRQASERAKAEEVRRRHQAETDNLKRQQQEQQQALARRQKEERKAAKQEHAQERDRSKQKDKDDKKKPRD
jgi:hypothetical protein